MTSKSPDSAPRAFISYSWTSPSHEQWVVALATELRSSGVDIVLDKWDLKEGHDAIAFMESMVADPAVSKVILIFDRAYVEKTDKRQGGVGTEAQIISPHMYSSQRQDKFAAIVTELDGDGRPYVPVYYKSRIYIDMSDATKYAERFEQLVRWIFDKPLAQKPALGKPPSYLEAENATLHAGTARPLQRRALQAIVDGSPVIRPLLDQYFQALSADIASSRLNPAADPFDDAVVASIANSASQRADFADLVDALARYTNGDLLSEGIGRGFEALLPRMYRPEDVTRHREWDWDNMQFQVNELVLITFASLLKSERFSEFNALVRRDYYFERANEYGEAKMVPYTSFRPYLRSLESRSERLGKGTGSRRTSIHADLLKERTVGLPVSFTQLMQADFTLYLHGEMADASRWYPVSLLYASRNGPFEVFARSRSSAYFGRLAPIFDVTSGDEFRTKLTHVLERDRAPQYGWHSLEVWELAGAKDIGARP